MPRRASEGKGSDAQSLRSAESEDDDNDYSEDTSTDTTLEEDEEAFRSKEGSGTYSQLSLPKSVSGTFGRKSRFKSVQIASRSMVAISEEVAEGIASRAQQAFRDILSRLLGAVSQFVHRVARVFVSRDDAERESDSQSSRQSWPHKESDTDVAEIRTFQDTICWKSDNHTVVFKRNPDQYTVFEIKQAGDPDKHPNQTKAKTPRIPKETPPLGTTVYRQPARAICIGSQQISGAVRVVLDYSQKVAFVQIISAKSEVYATYKVDNITFLNTCTPLGVAWVGDTFPPEENEPGSRKQSQRPVKTPSSMESAERKEKLNILREWIRSSRDFNRQSTNKTSNMTEDDSDILISQSESTDLLPQESSKTLRLLEADSSQLKQALGENRSQSIGDNVSTPKNVSDERNGSDNSKTKEEIISIDVVNIVFSNPDQAQRLIHTVETLKASLRQGRPPRLATFYDSTYSCGSSTVKSTTSEQLSNPSSDQESVLSLPPGYYGLASKLYNLRGIQSLLPEAKGQSDRDKKLNFDSTNSPMRRNYKDNNSLDKSLLEREVGKISDKQTAIPAEKQTDMKQEMNKELQRSDPNSQKLSNGTEKPFQAQSIQPYHSQASKGGLQENNFNLRNRNYADLHQQRDVERNPNSVQGQPVFKRQNGFTGAAPFPFINNQQEFKTPDPWQSLFYSSLNFPSAAGSQMAYMSGNPATSASRNHIYSNQMPSYCESQMLSTSRNQIPSFSTIMPTSFGNQMLINCGNQRPPSYGFQMPSTSGNQRHSAMTNQMLLPVGNHTPLSSYNELLPVASNSTSIPSQYTRCRVYRSINPSSIRRQWSITHPKPCNRVRVCHITEADDS